jgi:predicted kinase
VDKKLIATTGLPGSGKTTWALLEQKKLQDKGVKCHISSKDAIRKALTANGWVWSHENEKDVLMLQNTEIENAFNSQNANQVVIVTDTNFGKHLNRLRGLALKLNADFEVKDFTKVPLATCIERDANRPEAIRVGPQVITEMYNKYLVGVIGEKYVPILTKNPAIICDLDGTLALNNGKRSPYDMKKVGMDDVNDPVARIVNLFSRNGYNILYVSGRDESCRNATEMWLAANKLPAVGYLNNLWMRAKGDHRKDWIVKQELFDQHIRQNYLVRFVLDDRDQVVKMWRGLGLTCLQVDYGAF